MFRNQKIQRLIATVVLTTFTSLVMYPATAAAQVKSAMDKAGLLPKPKDESVMESAKHYINAIAAAHAGTPAVAASADERFAQLLSDILEDLKAVTPETAMAPEARASQAKGKVFSYRDTSPNQGSEPAKHTRITMKAATGASFTAHVKRIRSKAADINSLYADIDQSFKDTEQKLKDAKLPAEILKRHQDAVEQYQSRKAEFTRLITNFAKADDQNADRQSALAALGSFMAKYPNAKPHQYTDPNKLPFGTPNGKVRAPYTSKDQYQATLFPPQYQKLMVASLNLDGIKLAQATLPQIPNAPDTAETEDVQITQAIKDQAAALQNNPVKIYNWVRNNIQFIPSYGSIQGSDMTLQNKRGNAFDTASLLIAIYRAAGIPARYVYGTIDVPADKAMNWVGGVTKAEAVQSLLGQGGIPNVGITSGGQIKTIRMEHVWVEAYVDYVPSRGAVNKIPNTWVPMDASYKQYQFTSGMDIKTNVPINSQDLLAQIQQGATIDATNGYVQNLNQANIQTQMTAYQSQVENYIEAQKANAIVGDVLGTQNITPENFSILMGTLPYKTVTIANKFQTLPDNLKWKFRTNIYPADGISDGNSPIIEINQSTARLAGKKITLSFVPATQADQNLINSYLPKAHVDASPIQSSELPTSLPGYLLNMKAELRVDGQIVQTGGSFTMGSDVRQSNQYFNPANGSWEGGDYNEVTVGEYDAIGIDLQGTGMQQLQNMQTKIEATKAKLMQFQQNPGDATLVNGLTKEDITGDTMQTGILSYFLQVDSSDTAIANVIGNVKTFRLPSYGRFLTTAQPHYFFGVAKSVSFPGVMMDIDYLRYHSEANDDTQATKIQFMRQAGAVGSSAENFIPEMMFRNTALAVDDPSQPQGVSAVKALSIAASQGQKIYTLNQSNQVLHDVILQNLQISQDVKIEIADALASGKEVTVHEKDITVNGWTGNGYIVLDPTTGAGAYKISGGLNGGVLALLLGLGILAIALTFVGAWIIALVIMALMAEIIALAKIHFSCKWFFRVFSSLSFLTRLLTPAFWMVEQLPTIPFQIGGGMGIASWGCDLL